MNGVGARSSYRIQRRQAAGRETGDRHPQDARSQPGQRRAGGQQHLRPLGHVGQQRLDPGPLAGR